LYVWGDAVLIAPTLEAVFHQKKFSREEPEWMKTIISESYEAYYENGTLRWLGDKPSVKQASVIVTILSERETAIVALLKKSRHSSLIAGKGDVFGDIITPVSLEEG
jgi:ABC-type taurine transport system substrate-binding protein